MKSSAYSLFRRETTAEPQVDCLVREPSVVRPLLEGHSYSINCQPTRVSTVADLLCPSSPIAVARFVGSVVVSAFERVFVWSWPHVGEEVGEVHPPGAHRDPTRAVVDEGFASGVEASFFHAFPYRVLRCVFAFFSGAVSSASQRCGLSRQAPTRPGFSASKLACGNYNSGPALAPALPVGSTGLVCRDSS